jgi:membrane protease YdiL (CAAX protease family)
VLHAFRLDLAPEARNVLIALAVALACWRFSVTYAVLVPGPATSVPDLLTQTFGGGVAGMAVTFVLAAVVAPLLEELLLRGVVLGALVARIGRWPAIAASALVSASLHLEVWSLLPFAVLGVGLGWLATRGRSLWPAVVAHVLYNTIMISFAFAAAVH